MKKFLIVFSIYIIGCVVGYKYWKYNLQEDLKRTTWTKGDRITAIQSSIGSWATVCAMGFVHIMRNMGGDEEKASW